MENKKLQQFKSGLNHLKSEIEIKLRGLERVPEFGSDVDPDEETQESEAFSNQLSIAAILKNRLAAINHALDKFEKRNYGTCEKCGKAIEMALLELVPESKFCKECKKSANN